MKSRRIQITPTLPLLCGLMLCALGYGCAAGEPAAGAVVGFGRYVEGVEARLTRERMAVQDEARLRRGEVVVERLTPANGGSLPGALLHDWRGSAFAPGATAKDFERVMRDFEGYPQRYGPEVVTANVLRQDGDYLEAEMRVRQKHVITVVMDTRYEIRFGRVDARRGWSVSRSTGVAEIEGAGTAGEHALGAGEEHGFLWRLNTYWSYEERDGGLYVQMESVSLSRAIPSGLGWAVRPFVESVPRESVEFTLRATCKALRNYQQKDTRRKRWMELR